MPPSHTRTSRYGRSMIIRPNSRSELDRSPLGMSTYTSRHESAVRFRLQRQWLRQNALDYGAAVEPCSSLRLT